MDTKVEQDKAVLTVSQVREWIEKSNEYAEKKASLDRRIDAARLFLSPEDWETLIKGRASPDAPKGKLPSWTSVIMAGLNKAGHGLTYEELREVVKASPLKSRLAKSDKGFYGAVAKLEERDEVKRHNGRVYTIAAYKAFIDAVNAGLAVDDVVVPVSKRSPMGDAICEFVNQHVRGVKGADIIRMLNDTEEFSRTVGRNASAAYNVIARLVKQEKINKVGLLYFPPSANGESQNPDSASSLNGKGAPKGAPSTGGESTSSRYSH